MKKLLIVQNEFPKYREFFWRGISAHFELTLYDLSREEVVGGKEKKLPYQHIRFDYIVLNGSYKSFPNLLHAKLFAKGAKIIGWTQFVGRRRNILFRLIRSAYLRCMFDGVYLYYEHELELVPIARWKKKMCPLNNTVADVNEQIEKSGSDFFSIGRNTPKSKMADLCKAFKMSGTNAKLHLVGLEKNDILGFEPSPNIVFHGMSYDGEKILNVAKDCRFFIYAGDVGLSVIHGLKLGLIPIIHCDLETHMPEAKAIAQKVPVVYFQKDNLKSLVETINYCASIQGFRLPDGVKEKNIYSEREMVENFVSQMNKW